MGQSFPNLEEDKSNPPPKSPITMPEKRVDEGEIEIRYIRGKKKSPTTASTDFGEPKYFFVGLFQCAIVIYSCRLIRIVP